MTSGKGQGRQCQLLTQKQQLKVNSRYLRQTVPHVAFFSLNSPILVLGGRGQRALTTRTDWEDSQTPEGQREGCQCPSNH